MASEGLSLPEQSRGFLTVIAFLLAISSGTLYAWACVGKEIEDHFDWSHEAATDIFSLGFVGEFVPAFTFGLILKYYGAFVATVLATVITAASYLLIWIQTVHVWRVWHVFAGLHAVMGYGSIGFYFCALYIAGSIWPPSMTGRVLGFMAASYAGSGAVTAQIFYFCGELELYFAVLTALSLAVGVLSIAALHWATKKTSASEQPEIVSSVASSVASHSTTVAIPVPEVSIKSDPTYGATQGGKNNSRSPSRRYTAPLPTSSEVESKPKFKYEHKSTWLSDTVITQTRTRDPYEVMYGPSMPYEPQEVTWAVIFASLDFWALVVTFLCLNGTSLMLNAQLGTLRRMMGIHGIHTEMLVIVYQCSDCFARLSLAVVSDATAETWLFQRSFYNVVSNTSMFVALCLLLAGSGEPTTTLLLIVCFFAGFGNGTSSMIGPVIVKTAFGTQWIGVVLGLMKAGQALSNCVFGKLFVHFADDSGYPTDAYLASIRLSLCFVSASLLVALLFWVKSLQQGDDDF